MRVVLILLLIFIVFLAGCISPSTPFKNDIITLEQYSIYPTNPYAGSTVTIKFFVQNNGDKDVERTEINFFDLAGGAFAVNSLDCKMGNKLNDHTCVFNDIASLDSRQLTIVLQAPENIESQTSFTISYSVKYDYSGYRQANIPIIDDARVREPTTKYRESSPSYGPVQVDFEPPVGNERREDSKIIKEYWGVKGRAFSMEMNFKDVVSKAKSLNISKSKVSLTLEGLQIDPNLFCSFDSSGKAKEDVAVPKSLSCNFIPTAFAESEKTAIVGVSFDYTYEFVMTESLTVLPLNNV